MGEIAEMMLEGILDEYTGEYLGDACGYPRSRDPDHPSNCVHSDSGREGRRRRQQRRRQRKREAARAAKAAGDPA